MRGRPTVLHLDLDAFYASVEQRDKPSLRGKPVVVGGVGMRGVVATASYEARRFGVRSAMPTSEARARCPHAAFLSGRFGAYQEASRAVMEVLHELSPLVQPLSLDEAFVDLDHLRGQDVDLDADGVTAIATRLRERVREVTGGLTASVGAATSKLIAKIASDLAKPDGLLVVAPGTERELIGPMQATVVPGVGPATADRLRRAGLHTVDDLSSVTEDELVALLGQAHGASLYRLARAEDDRPVDASRETKSVSVEETFEHDVTGVRVLEGIVDRQAQRVAQRLARSQLSGRTITLKVRMGDFSTFTRSTTLPAPTDSAQVISRMARTLLDPAETMGGVRLLGVGVSGLADWVQEALLDERDLLAERGPEAEDIVSEEELTDVALPEPRRRAPYPPGADVVHAELGRGWVWGSGLGRVTVRFEIAESGPGPVRTFAVDDPALAPYDGRG